ncbi:uncharacterized protein LOC127864131 [Dreissena polymorpha]|nr:uncharacterized protein LOC127864131 [Dreissena polymorpha]
MFRNELKPTDIPLELIERDSGNYDVLPDDNNEDNISNYDVIPNDNNDNTDHYDVLPDDVHDDFIVPYAVVHLDNTEREATPMYTSHQPHITDDYLYTGLRESSYMIPASSYALGRICESETSVQTHSAMAEELDNAATSETKNKASEELINSTKEITTNASAEKLFDYVENEDNFEAETDYTGAKQEKNYESGATNYTDFVFWENDTQGEKNKSSGIKEYVFVLK